MFVIVNFMRARSLTLSTLFAFPLCRLIIDV
jgi:hypothetical protein